MKTNSYFDENILANCIDCVHCKKCANQEKLEVGMFCSAYSNYDFEFDSLSIRQQKKRKQENSYIGKFSMNYGKRVEYVWQEMSYNKYTDTY